MKAILTITRTEGDRSIKEARLFDTEKSRKLCETKNQFGFVVEELYLSPGGIFYRKMTNPEKLKTIDQELAKEYIGENCPDVYMEIFGKVKEA